MNSIKFFIQKLLKIIGYQMIKYPIPEVIPEPLRRRNLIIDHYRINTLFDIGANNGQYGLQMRKLGFNNKIISFEPLNDAFAELKEVSSTDQNWIINNYALGNENTQSVINIAGNSASSSLLNMLPKHLDSAPQSEYISQQEIELKKLDAVFESFSNGDQRIMLKIDTQGYEKNVIDGAEESLKNVVLVQMEMSIVPLYESELLFRNMIDYMEQRDFQLISLEEGFSNPNTGELLQVDGIFVNKKYMNG